MTTPELITDEIVERAAKALYKHWMDDLPPHSQIVPPYEEWCDKDYFRRCAKGAILAIQDDITRPYRNLLEGWKQNSEAYERALRDIRNLGFKPSSAYEIADAALKGDYHKTDFTEFCEQNPITDKE